MNLFSLKTKSLSMELSFSISPSFIAARLTHQPLDIHIRKIRLFFSIFTSASSSLMSSLATAPALYCILSHDQPRQIILLF